MRKKLSNIDISSQPVMYTKMKRDLINFYNKAMQKINNGQELQPLNIPQQDVYYFKYYTIDLWGWSGLGQWYQRLTNNKKLHGDLMLFKNIYLDPTLCLRQISDTQGKQLMQDAYWQKVPSKNKRKKLQRKNQMKCIMMIRKEIDQTFYYYGKYDQQSMVLQIKWNPNNLNQMILTLAHQLVHFLDHITAFNLEQNLQKLKKYINLNERDQQYKNDKWEQIYTKDQEGKKTDKYSLEKQFHPFLKETLMESNEICLDAGFLFHNYNINPPQILLYFSYMMQYNIKNNTNLTKQLFLKKLKQSDYQKSQDLILCFNHLKSFDVQGTPFNHCEFFEQLKKIKDFDIRSFKYIVSKMYEQNKAIYFKDTQLSKEILY